MKTKLSALFLVVSLLFSSCSQWQPQIEQHEIAQRQPQNDELDSIRYFLSLDKFNYYLNEYSVALEDKVPAPIIAHLRSITIQDIMNMELTDAELSKSANYDAIIFKILKEKGLTSGVKKEDLTWNYNFFKNKLDEAFSLAPSKLDIDLDLPPSQAESNLSTAVKPILYQADDMTLDSGHYISNRTTRAIFWEAIENQRAIDFHLGDSREFLKDLKTKGGTIVFEVKPLAKNYNKIFIVQYPGEDYRYAITNIGGQDRLDHLTHQISLSNFNKVPLKAKVTVKGDIKKFHAAKAQEHTLQLKLLPKADRVMIGQKESIDGKFNLFWKVKALKNLYDADSDEFNYLPAKDLEKLKAMMKATSFEVLFKDKKIVEDAFANFEKRFEKQPELLPGKFKIYNYDNFTIEMCDYVFESPDGKQIRWRVVSNVWGDEVIPIAQALKNTGHTNVSYMGTAGAFATKGHKVGDLVIPSHVRDGNDNLQMNTKGMSIDGAKYGGSVEHVGSPFEETKDWLAKAQVQSDFVEVETSYLRRIFNGPNDKLEIYLLISDILGSETETLAHATSSKRKNAQNKLLSKLFERDSAGIPVPPKAIKMDAQERIKNLVFTLLEKKSVAYRYYVYSQLKHNSKLTEADVLEYVKKAPAFSDAFLLERLVKLGELVNQIKKSHPEAGEFDVAFSKSLATGTWHPKQDKLNIIFKTKNAKSQDALEKALSKYSSFIKDLESFSTIKVSIEGGDESSIWMKTPEKIDPDFFVKIYALSGLKNAGLIKNVTYNGNITLDYLPTAKTENPLEAFYQGKTSTVAGSESSCMEAIQAFMQMIY